MSLFVSYGNKSRSALACDCATKLTAAKAKTLYDNGYRYVRVWNKEEDPSIVTENIFSEGKCLARRILKDGKYAGFIECVRDTTTNRYEVLFNAQGHKVSCSTYNDKNELIEYGVYEDGLYRITNQKLPQKNNSDPRSRS